MCISKLLPTGLVLPILSGPLRGRWWIIGAAAGEAKGLSIIFNLSEPGQLSYAARLLRPDSVCFDLGANVGFYTLLFATRAKHVYAFEPLPRNIRCLHRILEVNRINNATILPWAVSDKTTLSTFQQGENVAVGRLDPAGNHPTFTVALDDFVSTYGRVPSVVKIDVEGAELAVLEGSRRLLTHHAPTILLSTHSDRLRSDCFRLLQTLNYHTIIPLNARDIDGASEFAIFHSLHEPHGA